MRATTSRIIWGDEKFVFSFPKDALAREVDSAEELVRGVSL
jgi:hypothetical protein